MENHRLHFLRLCYHILVRQTQVLFESEGIEMSYTVHHAGHDVFVYCASDPETNYNMYYSDIEKKINDDGYVPETSIEHLIGMIVLAFDCDDNYGEYDESTGFGGYGDKFTLNECFRYIEDSGGYREFDYMA